MTDYQWFWLASGIAVVFGIAALITGETGFAAAAFFGMFGAGCMGWTIAANA